MRQIRRTGFTLLELLVVVVILTALIAVLLPGAPAGSRTAGRGGASITVVTTLFVIQRCSSDSRRQRGITDRQPHFRPVVYGRADVPSLFLSAGGFMRAP